MRNRVTALLGSGLLIMGALSLAGCDDTQLPQLPGVGDEGGGEDANENENENENENDEDEDEDEGD
ncbi:hypothetical protein [Arthrobacter sp. TB 23]|uniref:hypothetical protein n=1 Tax=Arthrobacter sp. TB 23 TaxID=494419 RepID=UPI000375FF1B|nr:hypothetical protein [Arthrobacter sp. TB 23]